MEERWFQMVLGTLFVLAFIRKSGINLHRICPTRERHHGVINIRRYTSPTMMPTAHESDARNRKTVTRRIGPLISRRAFQGEHKKGRLLAPRRVYVFSLGGHSRMLIERESSVPVKRRRRKEDSAWRGMSAAHSATQPCPSPSHSSPSRRSRRVTRSRSSGPSQGTQRRRSRDRSSSCS